jgi:hypothetical protein
MYMLMCVRACVRACVCSRWLVQLHRHKIEIRVYIRRQRGAYMKALLVSERTRAHFG